MAKKPETKFKERVVPKLRALPRMWLFKAQLLSVLGIPDIIMCFNGHFAAWELKVGKNKASKKQKLVLSLIARAGGHVAVVYPETFDNELIELTKHCFERP